MYHHIESKKSETSRILIEKNYNLLVDQYVAQGSARAFFKKPLLRLR